MPHLQWTYAAVWFLLFFQPRAQNLTALFQSLPVCAQGCFYADLNQIEASGCSDIQCFCDDTSLIQLVESCLQQCSQSDQQQTFQALHPYCPSLSDPFGGASSSTSTAPTIAPPTSPTSTAPTVVVSSSTPPAHTASSTYTAHTIAASTSSTSATLTIIKTHTVSTSRTIPTGSIFTSSSTTSTLPVFTGAATLPVANLAFVGVGLVGAFQGLF